MSIRGDRFKQVAHDTYAHINEYTVPRYGDAPNDLIQHMTPHECLTHAEKYCRRRMEKERFEGERKQDCLKAIHFLSEAYVKMIEIENI